MIFFQYRCFEEVVRYGNIFMDLKFRGILEESYGLEILQRCSSQLGQRTLRFLDVKYFFSVIHMVKTSKSGHRGDNVRHRTLLEQRWNNDHFKI